MHRLPRTHHLEQRSKNINLQMRKIALRIRQPTRVRANTLGHRYVGASGGKET